MSDGASIARSRQATRLDAIEGRFDPWLLGVSVALACFGLVMVASSSSAIGEGLVVGPFYFLIRHAVVLGVGCCASRCCWRYSCPASARP